MSDAEKSKSDEELQKVVQDVTSLAEQVQLKLHLGGMDAKDAWQRLEPRVSELKQRVASTSEALGRDLNKSASELKTELHDLGKRFGLTK
jgi:hypothetical protein